MSTYAKFGTILLYSNSPLLIIDTIVSINSIKFCRFRTTPARAVDVMHCAILFTNFVIPF